MKQQRRLILTLLGLFSISSGGPAMAEGERDPAADDLPLVRAPGEDGRDRARLGGPAGRGDPTIIQETLILSEDVCTIEIAADSVLSVCAGDTILVSAILTCGPGYTRVADPQWFLDGVPAGTGDELVLACPDGTHTLRVTCNSCADEITIEAAPCPLKPGLDALFSRDETEGTRGIYLQPNIAPVNPFNFSILRFLMRPCTLRPPSGAESGEVVLERAGDGVIELFRGDGTSLALPAVLDLGELPLDFLINAAAFGEDTLSATYLSPLGDDGPTRDEIRVRVDPFPGISGVTLDEYPFFHFVDTFNSQERIQCALDPSRHAERIGRAYDLYVVAHKPPQEWARDNTLIDAGDGVEEATLAGGSIRDNIVTACGAGLDPGPLVNRSYDVVCDFGRDGALDPGDLIDGFSFTEAGVYAVRDLVQPGPYAVTQAEYNGGTWLRQRIYYPSNLAELPQAPLVMMSHGNGHNYTWYDYLGQHFASYGYVFMSHSNNTAPGSESASTTTLTNTDHFVTHLDEIAGGALQGHVDVHRIVWIGHSIGGEGVVRAYDRLHDGEWQTNNFRIEDIILVSGIAPAVGLNAEQSDPHDVNYHMMVGGADGDIGGYPSCAGCQPFRLVDRADGIAHGAYIHGADHNDFNCCGWNDEDGPDPIGREEAQRVAKGYYLALVETYAKRNRATREFFTRMYDDIHPAGIAPHVEIATMYREANRPQNFVVDDFQTVHQVNLSSSGGPVTFTVSHLYEGRNDDADSSYAWNGVDAMNGMTFDSGYGDDSRGAIFDYTVGPSRYLEFGIVEGHRDVRGMKYVSFRACQGTRHPETVALDGEHSFSVTLRDGQGRSSTIHFGSWGTLTPLYKRTGWGEGEGWYNEMNTVRIPVAAFATDGSGIDLSDVVGLRLEFGGSYGSPRGRIGLDDVQFMRE